jgi:hypothetical protein
MELPMARGIATKRFLLLMKVFKALEGRAPKTQAEFMQRIIKEGQINLPELPAGYRYVYDPKEAQLMVEQPAAER